MRYGISVFKTQADLDANVEDGQGRTAETVKEAVTLAYQMLKEGNHAIDILDLQECRTLMTIDRWLPEHLQTYRSDISLADFVKEIDAFKHNGRLKEYWYECPKCEIGFRKMGSHGSKACPMCGYTRTKSRND